MKYGSLGHQIFLKENKSQKYFTFVLEYRRLYFSPDVKNMSYKKKKKIKEFSFSKLTKKISIAPRMYMAEANVVPK